LKKLTAVDEIAKADAFLKFLTADRVADATTDAKNDAKAPTLDELPEDVEVTGVAIPGTRLMSDHVLYQIDVVNARKRKTFSKWTVLKRFGQFYDMDTLVRASFAENLQVLAAMPPQPQRRAKLFNDHMDSAFVESRRVLLENYLQKMMCVIDVVRNKDFLQFIGVNI